MSDKEKDVKDLGRGSFWLFVGIMAGRVLGIVFAMIMTRLFPQEEIGLYSIALSTISLFTIFTDFGISGIIQTYVGNYYGKEDYERIKKLMHLVFALGVGSSLVIVGGFWLFPGELASFSSNKTELVPILGIFSIYLVLNALFTIGQYFVLSFRQAKQTSLSQTIQLISRIALIPVALAVWGASAASLTVLFVVSFGLGTVFVLYYAWRIYSGFPTTMDTVRYKELAGEVLPFGLAMMGGSVVATIFSNIDRILLDSLLEGGNSASLIAIYAICLSFGTLLQVFSSAIGGIFIPIIANIHGKNENDFSKISELTNTSTKWSLLATGSLFVFILLFPSEILGVLYGNDYAQGGTTLFLIVLGFFFFTIGYSWKNAFIALKRAGLNFGITVSGLVISLAINLFGIPIYGIEAAGAAFMSFYLSTFALAYYYGNKKFGFGFLGWFGRSILLLIALFIVFFFLKGMLVSLVHSLFVPLEELANREKFALLFELGIIFSIISAIYALGIIYLRLLNKNEIVLIGSFLRKARIPGGIVVRIEKLPHAD